MRLYSSLPVCGLMVVQLEEVKMMKKTKRTLVLFGKLPVKLNSLNKDYVSIITMMLKT
jgi:hypothetical protein